MSEYIDKEAFKKSVEERYCKPCKAEGKDHNGCWCRACWVDDMLDEVDCFKPADVVPVVRCKDCKYYKESRVLAPNKFCFRLNHPTEPGKIGYNFADNDFCSRGVRRNEGRQ